MLAEIVFVVGITLTQNRVCSVYPILKDVL